METIKGENSGINSSALIATVSGVDLNVTTKSNLFTVPTGKTLVVSRVTVRNASTSLTTASFGFGFNASANDVVTASLHTMLVDNTLYEIVIPITGSKIGNASDVLGVKCSIAQGVAATVTIDVFGYLV